MRLFLTCQGVLFGPGGWIILIVLLACADHASKLDESAPAIRPLLSEPTDSRPRVAPAVRVTHLIICGDRARLSGTDLAGTVTHDTRSSCTVVFATVGHRDCSIVGGTVSDSNERMMTIRQMTGGSFSYHCNEAIP